MSRVSNWRFKVGALCQPFDNGEEEEEVENLHEVLNGSLSFLHCSEMLWIGSSRIRLFPKSD